MNAERLLAHFDRVADAAGAVGRLRRFVLDLAVRGRLVEQDQNTAPVGVLLAERGMSTSDSRQFEIPPTWAWVRVGAVSESRLGKMLDRSRNTGTPRRYLRNVNVRWFDFDLSDLLEMRFEDSELPEFALRSGDVLICEGGEPGRAAVWDGREDDIYFQKAIHRVRFSDLVVGQYFVGALRASADDGRLAEYFTGTTIKHFTGTALRTYVFPLPPLAEQHRIVAKVDDLMALCDRLEETWASRENTRDRLTQASLTRLSAPDTDEKTYRAHARFAVDALPALTPRTDQVGLLRQTILSLAVRGKLVRQDQNTAPVGVLLAERGMSTSDSRQFEIPPTWAWVRVGAVSESRLGKMLDRSRNTGTPRRYLRNVNVRWFDFDLSDLLEMRFEDSELPEFALRSGDVLICEGGEPGRAAVWDGREDDIYFQKAIHRVRFSDLVVGQYFVGALRASADDGRLAEYFTGTTIKHFTGTALRTYVFPLPPLAEQHRIVGKVDELMALCDQLEAGLDVVSDAHGCLLNSLLHKSLGFDEAPINGTRDPVPRARA